MTAPDLRDCHLYRFWVRHPLTGKRVLGYIGETVRMPFERLMEHVMSQPWADTILAWEVDEVIYPGKPAVLIAEAAAIRAEKPLYNVRGNEDNKKRITPPDAIRQRRDRDAQARKTRWVHPDDREQTARPSTRLSERTRSWSPARIKAGLWSAGWVLMQVATWAGLHQWELPVTWVTVLAPGTLAYASLIAWTWAGHPTNGRQVRAACRRSRRKTRARR